MLYTMNFRNSAQPYHLSAENLLVGSTCVRGSAFGDFSAYCVCTDWKY